MIPDQTETIQTYEIRGQLGAGGMGEVVRAWDGRLRREVAIKRLRRDLAPTDRRRKRLRLEAQAAARLNHPAIVQLFDIVEDAAGNDCLVMELVEGRTLADRIAHGTIDVATALRIARQIADGLNAAHARGLVHRDLKAENVMVDEAHQVKILDFGLAKLRSETYSQDTLTREGTLVGTFRTMSPEQALGREVDGRSDLFSLGVLLYEMLLGRSPFTGTGPMELFRNIVDRPAVPPHVVRPDLPEPLSAFVLSLLEKDSKRRPADAATVSTTLVRLVEMPGVNRLGPPPKPLPRSSDATTRLPVAWNRPTFDEPESRPTEASRQRQRSWFLRHRWAAGALTLAALWTVGARFLDLGSPSSTHATPGSVQQPEPLSTEQALVAYQSAWTDLESYYQPRSVDRAISGFQHVISSGHMSAAAHAGLARAYWRKFHWRSMDPIWLDRADSLARRAIELDSELAVARVSAGLVAIDLDALDRARQQLGHALMLDPGDPEAHFALAYLEHAAANGPATRVAIVEAARLGKDDSELHNLMGSSWFEDGAYDEALAAFETAVEIAPDNAISLRNLGAARFKLGEYDAAAAAIQRALTIRPSGSLYTNLGTYLFYQGLYPQAANAMEKALTFPSGANSYLHWANLGDTYRQIPGYEASARDAYRRAIELMDERTDADTLDVTTQSRRILYLAKRGGSTEAAEALGRWPELLESDNGVVHYRLAQAFEVLGRREDALDAIRRALEAGYPVDEIRRDPELTDLRGDLRFHRILLAELPDRPSEPSSSRYTSEKGTR